MRRKRHSSARDPLAWSENENRRTRSAATACHGHRPSEHRSDFAQAVCDRAAVDVRSSTSVRLCSVEACAQWKNGHLNLRARGRDSPAVRRFPWTCV